MINEAMVLDKLGAFFCSNSNSGVGIVCRQNITNFYAAKESAKIAGIRNPVLMKDLRGAPFLKSDEERAFLSVSDEDGTHCAVVFRPEKEDKTAGIGIDIASIYEFRGGKIQFAMEKRFFSEAEKTYIESFPKEEQALRCAVLFSAKEAAIKSVADLVRNFELEEKISERISIEDFEISFSSEHGTAAPKEEVVSVAEKLGISGIEVLYIILADYVITAAKCKKT